MCGFKWGSWGMDRYEVDYTVDRDDLYHMKK